MPLVAFTRPFSLPNINDFYFGQLSVKAAFQLEISEDDRSKEVNQPL